MKCTPPLTSSPYKYSLWLVVFYLLSLLLGCSSTTNTRPSSLADMSVEERVKSSVSVSDDSINKYKLALLKMKNNDVKSAKSLFREVSNANPNLFGPYINLGIIFLKQKNYTQAEVEFQHALGVRSNSADVYNYLGVVYRQQGKFSEAKNAYMKAISIDKNMAKIYLNLGILNDIYLGDYVEAKNNYIKYQQLTAELVSERKGRKDFSDNIDKKIEAWLADLNSRIQASAQ